MPKRHDQRHGHLTLVDPNCTHARAYRHPSGRAFCPDCTLTWHEPNKRRIVSDYRQEANDFEEAMSVLVENGLLTDDTEVKDEE